MGTAICILGMHRSGTSCLAGSLEQRGLFLGQVVNSAPFNKKGNKENVEIREINDAVLRHSGGAWDRPPLKLTWNDALRKRRASLLAQFSEHDLWAFKDPRSTLTLPFWQEGIPDLKLVGTFRLPAKVCRSLNRRPSMKPRTPALDLWIHYNQLLLEQLERGPFPLICFDWEPPRYLEALNTIADDLKLGNTGATTVEFFDRTLRNDVMASGADKAKIAEASQIYERLLSYAHGANVPLPPSVEAK